MRVFATGVAALAAALSVSACGGSSGGSGTTGRASGSPAPAVSATGADTNTTSNAPAHTTGASTPGNAPATTTPGSGGAPVSGGVSPSSSSGGSRCRAGGLALRFLGQQGAAGHGELGFALRNTGSTACRTYGFPGVQFLAASGGALPTASTRVTHDLFGSAIAEAVTVQPGESVSFRLGVTHGVGSSSGCTTAHGLQAIPPDDTGTLRVTIPDGAYECGTATVSPVRPGESAYP